MTSLSTSHAVFIYDTDDITYLVKRGGQVIRSVLRNSNSFGLIGSDALQENARNGLATKSYGNVTDESGNVLRFALISRVDAQAQEKIDRRVPLSLVTSYPVVASTTLGSLGIGLASIEKIDGCIEAEVAERQEFDAAFELVQSGQSIDANKLVIVRDNLRAVELLKITKGNYYDKQP